MVYSLSTRLSDSVRVLVSHLDRPWADIRADTGLSEILLPLTKTEQFNKSLEIQQSKLVRDSSKDLVKTKLSFADLLASYEVNSQIAAVEDMIAQGAELHVVLRLLCLASITVGGIKTKVLENLKREILQVGVAIFFSCICIFTLAINRAMAMSTYRFFFPWGHHRWQSYSRRHCHRTW